MVSFIIVPVDGLDVASRIGCSALCPSRKLDAASVRMMRIERFERPDRACTTLGSLIVAILPLAVRRRRCFLSLAKFEVRSSTGDIDAVTIKCAILAGSLMIESISLGLQWPIGRLLSEHARPLCTYVTMMAIPQFSGRSGADVIPRFIQTSS